MLHLRLKIFFLRCSGFLMLTVICAPTCSVFGATQTLNVTDYGARGDAIQALAVTSANSRVVTLKSGTTLSSADVGKVIELFGVGAATTGSNYQDLIALILSVTNGTNLIISVPAGRGSNAVNCTIGSQNAPAFQACVDACVASNTDIIIPSGRYLLVPPPVLDSNYKMNDASVVTVAVNLHKGGIRFLGADLATTILLGNGAWVLKGAYVQRGILFGCVGPVTNNTLNTPLVFENLTMDGGVQAGNQTNVSFPASVTDGSGWDITHDAVEDLGPPPLHALKEFVNCRFVRWRGEMLKSVYGNIDGLILVTNCAFLDGDASAFNFTFTHRISGCFFSNLFEAIEFNEGYMQGNSVFENSTVTNVVEGIVLLGALANRVQPSYTVSGNKITASRYGILCGGVENLLVTGNQFPGGNAGLGNDGGAYLGTAINSNIVVQNNTFVGNAYPLVIAGAGLDGVVNMTWQSNTAWGCAMFANGYGWSSNVTLLGNKSLPLNGQHGRIWSQQLAGQYLIDDESNLFPTNVVNVDSSNPTNTVSYAYGMRQSIQSDGPNCAAILDTSSPRQIPAGVIMDITYSGQYPARLYLSSQGPAGDSLMLSPSEFVQCQWSNGKWNVLQPVPPPAPQNLHISNP